MQKKMIGEDDRSVYAADDETGDQLARSGDRVFAPDRSSFLSKDEKLAYLIVCALLCLCCVVLFRFHPWLLAWGLAWGGWRFACAMAAWLILAATSFTPRSRAEFSLITLQFLLTIMLAPLHGVSLPAGLLLSCLVMHRIFVRLPLRNGPAAVYISACIYLGFILPRLGGAGGQADEEFIILVAGSAFGVWLSLIVRWQLDQRVKNTMALRRVQAVTSELFDANVYLQDRVDRATSEAACQERLLLARELHDTVAYTFTTIAAAIETGTELIGSNPEMAIRELHYARSLTTEGLREVREVVRHLREKAERGFRGPERWRILANVFHGATNVTVTMDIIANFPQIAAELDEMIYRLIQEGMINAFRHGRATVIWVRVWLERSHLCVLISDNGGGAKEVGVGFGLLGMQERVHALGGRLSWRTSPDTGFDLAVEIPFEERRNGRDDQGASG